MELERLRERGIRRIEEGGREAAVLVPLLERDREPRLLLTKRADHLPNHPGQMSFPGGRREPGDGNRLETALRETEEEVGVPPTEVEPRGRLDDLRTVSNFVITPIVGEIRTGEFVRDEREVVELHEFSVSTLADPQNHERRWRWGPDGTRRRVEIFQVGDCTIWGATGRILAQFLELTTDWTPSTATMIRPR